MSAKLIDGKAIAQHVRAEVREEVAAWVAAGNPRPGLATVLVGDDPASAVYVGGKQKACAEVGIEGFSHQLPPAPPRTRSSSCWPSSAPTTACRESCCSSRPPTRSTVRI